jgi:hypothetical protein
MNTITIAVDLAKGTYDWVTLGIFILSIGFIMFIEGKDKGGKR